MDPFIVLPLVGALVLAVLGWLALFDPDMFRRKR